jgi:predicted nucleic acid-binding protein
MTNQKKQPNPKVKPSYPKNLVIDEWIFHCIIGENGKAKQELAGIFISRLMHYPGKIMYLKESPFAKKANLVQRIENPKVRGLSQFFQSSIIRDSLKTIMIETNQVKELPKHLACVPDDDKYLFQTYRLRKNACIITTDERLIKILQKAGITDINIMTIEKFLEQF